MESINLSKEPQRILLYDRAFLSTALFMVKDIHWLVLDENRLSKKEITEVEEIADSEKLSISLPSIITVRDFAALLKNKLARY